jgi:hypothetical protein
MRWTPDKLTALILICSCVVLIALHVDSEVKSILTVAAGYLFGTGIAEARANRRGKQCRN